MDSVTDTLAGGLPHSDIRGSTIARISPRLFAACHVLHRLLVPRHPPNALLTLEIQSRPRHAQDPSTPPNRGMRKEQPRTGQSALSTQHNQRVHEHLQPRSGPLASHKEKPRLRSDGYDRGSAHAPPEPSSTVKHHARTGPTWSGRQTVLGGETRNRPGASSRAMETVGIEPTTPCLQSRCSPAELRPR